MARKGILLRLEPDLAEAVAKAAAADGVSVNAWLCEAVEGKLSGDHRPSSAGTQEAMAVLADAASKLARGFVLVPESESLGGSWDQMMGPDPKKSG